MEEQVLDLRKELTVCSWILQGKAKGLAGDGETVS
jgi:hypothetical protein